MIDEVNIKDINLEMIVNERINFIKNNNVFNKDEYESVYRLWKSCVGKTGFYGTG